MAAVLSSDGPSMPTKLVVDVQGQLLHWIFCGITEYTDTDTHTQTHTHIHTHTYTHMQQLHGYGCIYALHDNNNYGHSNIPKSFIC